MCRGSVLYRWAYYFVFFFFFFNDTAPAEIYTLSLHDALPILRPGHRWIPVSDRQGTEDVVGGEGRGASQADVAAHRIASPRDTLSPPEDGRRCHPARALRPRLDARDGRGCRDRDRQGRRRRERADDLSRARAHAVEAGVARRTRVRAGASTRRHRAA